MKSRKLRKPKYKKKDLKVVDVRGKRFVTVIHADEVDSDAFGDRYDEIESRLGDRYKINLRRREDVQTE